MTLKQPHQQPSAPQIAWPFRSIALLTILALGSGCAGRPVAYKPGSARTVAVGTAEAKSKTMVFATPTSAVIGAASLALGMGGVLNSAVRIAAEKPTPEPKAQVEATVPAAFAQELQHLGGFTLAQPSQADAVFSLEIPCYGFQLKGMGGRMEPIVSLAGVLKSREGRVLWRNNVITKGDRDGLPYATSGELKRDPEKVRAGLDAASKVAARRLAATLR